MGKPQFGLLEHKPLCQSTQESKEHFRKWLKGSTRQEAALLCVRTCFEKHFLAVWKAFLLSTVPREPWVPLSPVLSSPAQSTGGCSLLFPVHLRTFNFSATRGAFSCLNAAFRVGTKANHSWLYKVTDGQDQLTVQLPHPCWGPVRNSAKAQEDTGHVLVTSHHLASAWDLLFCSCGRTSQS